MIFGISDQDLLDKNKIKIINGIAGSGKSTQTVKQLEKLGVKFCLASFSNALKFAAADKFNCDTDTICGLCYVNNPFPRSEEKEIIEYNTVVLDEILLDGCLDWIRHNVKKVNIIALTDSRQMLNSENGNNIIKSFDRLCKRKDVICVEVNKTKRARNNETVNMYDELYKINSDQLFTINQVQAMFKCNIVDFDNVLYDKNNTYICHSNRIEHEIYKRFNLSENRTNDLIPKNHIARNRVVNFNKYPICDQITATEKRVNAYLQVANVATPTRFQGKEVEAGDNCYFIIEEDSLFTGREIYTVGTRCQDRKSLNIAIIKVTDYKDPYSIKGVKVVNAKRLDIERENKKFKCVDNLEMSRIIKEYGENGVYYYKDFVTSGDHIIYSTLNLSSLYSIADVDIINNEAKLTFKKKSAGARKTIMSITKKDTSMHFDFMPRVYSIIGGDIMPPRIINPKKCKKEDFNKMCDIYSAFPTILHNADMPSAGFLYEEYDKELLNFYVYEGSLVTKGSVITEELANLIGDSRYVFSTKKQKGCEIGHYTYEQSRKSKEKKANLNKNFLWGQLESDYYKKDVAVVDGEMKPVYIKHTKSNLELVACALWSQLCIVMLNAIKSIKCKQFVVVTDGLYYNGDIKPVLPEWCDHRIIDKAAERVLGGEEKYNCIEYKTYKDPMTEKEKDKERKRKKRAEMSEEEREAIRKKDAERKRKKRAEKAQPS